MNVYCYYEPAGEDATRLIELWKASWIKHGWTPFVLTRELAMKSEYGVKMLEAVTAFPTVNKVDYSIANFMRYCALDTIGAGLLSDYDNINYGLNPDHLWHVVKYAPMLRLFRGGFTYFSKDSLRDFIEFVLKPGNQYRSCFMVNGKPHVCDVAFLDALNVPIKPGLSVLYREYGWMSAPTVHYSNDSVAGRGDKAELIQKVRPI